ncbi:MAG: class I SAM-dependent methyltransferase [Thermoflexales bacterium]|nr:class I SAM-dependent methyltransferase [Thermoflexales bacterium]
MPSDFFDDSVAAHYEGWYETGEGRRADRLEKGLLGWLLTKFPGAASVLEVGCGTGHFSRWLDGEGLRAVGLDRSGPMLAQARMLDSVPLVCGDGHRLPFADGAFDIAMLVTTLEFLERPREALREAVRVARRGLILGVLNRWSLLGLSRRLAGLRRRTVYDTAHFYGVGELKQLLRSVAGEKVHIQWRTTLFPRGYPSERSRLPWGGFIGMAVVLEGED